MSKVLVWSIFCLGMTSVVSTVNIHPTRAEPRSSTGAVAQAAAAAATATVTNDQEATVSKSIENSLPPTAGVFGYAVSQGGPPPPMPPNPYGPPPTGMNSYVYSAPTSNNNPILGVSSNGEVTLSAYFGPIFWGFVTGLVVGIVVVVIINLFGGFEYMGSAIRGIGSDDKKNGKSRSLDLDTVTSLVYRAMEKYNKWNANPRDNLF